MEQNQEPAKPASVQKYYAHSLEGKPPEYWQLLEDHLKNAAELAKRFSESFCGGSETHKNTGNF